MTTEDKNDSDETKEEEAENDFDVKAVKDDSKISLNIVLGWSV